MRASHGGDAIGRDGGDQQGTGHGLLPELRDAERAEREGDGLEEDCGDQRP